nr:MAG TPA: hypothetical protein [Caudoviricetes sp.]
MLPNKNKKVDVVMETKSKCYHDAKIQALWERNQRQDENCLEVLTLLTLLAVLFTIAF